MAPSGNAITRGSCRGFPRPGRPSRVLLRVLVAARLNPDRIVCHVNRDVVFADRRQIGPHHKLARGSKWYPVWAFALEEDADTSLLGNRSTGNAIAGVA